MLNILHEDNHIIVVEKPFNQLTQSDRTSDKSLFEEIKEYIKEKYNKPGNVYLGLVHRIDRPVKGIIVFAKTSKAASRLSEQLRVGEFTKKYYAVCKSVGAGRDLPNQYRTLTHYIKKLKSKNRVLISDTAKPGYKESVLEYRKVKKLPAWAIHELPLQPNTQFFEINLITGRPHQIRAQLSHIGHPILGDIKYGAKQSLPNKNIALINYYLSFQHPTLKEKLEFKLK